MRDYLRRAEDLGFEAAFTIDHLLIAGPAYTCTWLEPMTFLAALAGATEKMLLGTLVLVLPLRNPVYLAKEWATLDVLSGGRSILGIGSGWHEQEFDVMEVPRKERGRRTTEALQVIEALWTKDNVTFEGRYYRFENVTIEPKPVQKPRPPIWIGGGSQPFERLYGQKAPTISRVLQRIARYTDAWIPHSSTTPDMVKADWDELLEYLAQENRTPESLQRVYSNFVYPLKAGEAPDVAAPAFSAFSGMDLDYWREHYLLGQPEELVDRINRRMESLGGVDWVVLNPVDWDPERLEMLGTDVCPHVGV